MALWKSRKIQNTASFFFFFTILKKIAKLRSWHDRKMVEWKAALVTWQVNNKLTLVFCFSTPPDWFYTVNIWLKKQVAKSLSKFSTMTALNLGQYFWIWIQIFRVILFHVRFIFYFSWSCKLLIIDHIMIVVHYIRIKALCGLYSYL